MEHRFPPVKKRGGDCLAGAILPVSALLGKGEGMANNRFEISNKEKKEYWIPASQAVS